jgi:hypothetical protein
VQLGDLALRGRSGDGAAAADRADQALGDHERQRAGDEVRRHAEVAQPDDGARGVVGVQGGQHHVAGHGGLQGQLRRLPVTDLTDHDDVGVLTEDRAQAARERAADPLLDVRLVDARRARTRRVLEGDDVAGLVGEVAQPAYSVEVLPEPVGPVMSTRPCGRSIALEKPVQLLGVEADLVEAEPLGALAQQTDDDGLAVQRRQARDAEVDLVVADTNRARPSWGSRRSAMSIEPMSFMRAMNCPMTLRGTTVCSCSTPSMR